MIKITFKNEKRIIRAFEKAPKEMKAGINKVFDKLKVEGVKDVKQIINRGTDMWKRPVDTGAMRQGIGASRGTMKVTITPSPKTDYAGYVHEGTRKMKKRPFFEITKKRKEKDIVKLFKKEIEKVISKIK